jgi:DNA-binding PadR family transcriptional regulator
MRRTAMVPKGFLRYQLLKMLKEKPMSGSEIMSELENRTNGYWKPSPGSIYPLLAWLQDQSYIKEAEQKEPAIRRYSTTEQGKAFLENEAKSREEVSKHFEHLESMPGGLSGRIWSGLDQGQARDLRKTAGDLTEALRDLFHVLRRESSKEKLETARQGLEKVTREIQDIARGLQE